VDEAELRSYTRQVVQAFYKAEKPSEVEEALSDLDAVYDALDEKGTPCSPDRGIGALPDLQFDPWTTPLIVLVTFAARQIVRAAWEEWGQPRVPGAIARTVAWLVEKGIVSAPIAASLQRFAERLFRVKRGDHDKR